MDKIKRQIKIGARIHDIVREGENLTSRLKETEVELVQLTLPKFVSWSELPQDYSPDKLKELKMFFDEANVEIKVLSCYINPLAVDVEQEQELFKRFVDYCTLLNVKFIGTESGSAVSNIKDYRLNLTEENYKKVRDCFECLAKYANAKGITIGIETVSYYPICSCERFERLTKDLGHAKICSIFDATNLLNADNYTMQREIIGNFIQKHADKIEVVHLKDFVIKSGTFVETALFHGWLDINFVLTKLKECGVEADIIVECSRSVHEFKGIKNKLKKMIAEM